MYRRPSTNLSTTPLEQARGGFRKTTFLSVVGGGGLKRSTSGSNFGFRPNLGASGGAPVSDGSARRNLAHSVASTRPIGAHFSSRSAFSIKDPRNLSDKSYQAEMARNVIEFLMDYKCPLNFTEKSLRLPPTNEEFKTIFELMYNLFHPGFKVKNIKEEVPSTFKLLGYPFVINPSTMKTINASHSWPTLLGALNWLRELAQAGLTWDVDRHLFASDEGESVPSTDPYETLRKAIFEYNVQCYSLHLEGHEQFEAQNQFMNDFILRSGDGDGGLDQLQAENERLLEELKMLESSAPEHEKLLEECQRMELDWQKMVDYVSKNEEFQRAKKIANKEMKQEVERFGQEIKDLRREIERKDSIISQQDISPAEVKRMTMAKHELHSKIKSLVAEGERLEKVQYQTEIQMHKDREKIDTKMTEFKLKSKNLFTSSKLSLDPNWIEYVDVDFSPFDPKFSSHYKESLRPGIDLVIQLCNKAVHDSQSDLHKLQETKDSLDEEIKVTEDEIQSFDEKIKEADEKIHGFKQGKNADIDRAKNELERLKLQFDELEACKTLTCSEKEKQMNVLMKEKDEKTKKFKSEIEAWYSMLSKETELILDHQQFIEKGQQETFELLENCHKIL